MDYRGTTYVISDQPVPEDERPKARLGFQPPRHKVAVKAVVVIKDPERERALRGA